MATAYRVNVFATRSQTIGKGKRQRVKTIGYGYQGWNRVQDHEPARLAGSGSFIYPGFIRAREAAMQFLALPETHQVSIRTNQDRAVYRYFKHADGTVTSYADGDI